MRAKIVLLARVPDGQGNFPFVIIETANKKGKLTRPVAPEGATAYYLRYSEHGKRRVEAVGQDIDQAFTAFCNKEVTREYLKRGMDAPALAGSDRPTISEAVAQFIKNQAALDKAPATVYVYTRAAEQFRDSCRRVFMDELDRQAIIDHIQWLRENVPTREHGQQNGTIRARLQYLSVFLRENGFTTMPLPKKEWPKVEARKPKAYTGEQVNALLSKATEDEKDLILFFLTTGFRDNEAAHTFWSDVDFKRGTVNVSDKPKWGFRIKNHKQRKSDITLPADCLARLKARRERCPEGDLIFPNSNGRPDSALLERVRKAAKRAGIKERITLHSFRKTFGTRYGMKHGIVNAQHLLGHADIRTTQLYMAETEIPRAAVEELFSDVGK
jgi:integrase